MMPSHLASSEKASATLQLVPGIRGTKPVTRKASQGPGGKAETGVARPPMPPTLLHFSSPPPELPSSPKPASNGALGQRVETTTFFWETREQSPPLHPQWKAKKRRWIRSDIWAERGGPKMLFLFIKAMTLRKKKKKERN